MGIDVSKFKQGINEAKASLKTLDAALKLNETQLKATGDKEVYLANKTATLKAQIEAQGNIVKTTTAALQAMDKAGVNPLSTDYQKLQAQLYQANEAMIESTSSLSQLEAGAEEASESTDKLSDSVGSIGKKLSLDAVIGGIDKITGTMKKAAEMAVNLGKAIWENISDSASWADNVATQATILGMSVEDYQKLQSVFDTIADVTVADWTAARRKIRQAINDPSTDQIDVLAALGISTHESAGAGKFGEVDGIAKDWETVFWEAARELQRRVESGEMSADLADTWGEALFGKKYSNLLPLIGKGQEEFNKALENETVVSEEAVEKLAALNDAYVHLQDDFRDLKAEVMSSLAPALEGAANVLDTLLNNLMAYLKTDDGKKALEDLEKAVSGLFEDLGKIDPESVVEGFTGVFNTVVGSLQWLTDNWEGCVNALKWIVGGWAALEVTGGALTIVQLINGINGLTTGGATAGAAAGAAWGGAFANAVLAAAPWLAGLITLLVPAGGAGNSNDSLFDEKTGKLTTAGWADFYNNANTGSWKATIEHVGELFGDLGRILTDTNAINAMAAFKTYGDEESLIRTLEALGYIRKLTDKELNPETDQTKGTDTTGFTDPDKVYRRDPRTGKMTPVLDVELPESGEKVGLTQEQLNAVERMWDAMRTTGDFTDAEWTAYENAFKGQNELFKLIDDAMNHLFQTNNMTEEDLKGLPEDFFTANITPEFPEGAEEFLQGQLNQMGLGVIVKPIFADGQDDGHHHANGLPRVPWDGYPAILHKDETIVPARQINNSRNFSSNLYVENMNMNGASAEGLAATMAAAQRRMMRGYGS